MTFSYRIRRIFRFFGIIATSLILSGCLLLSDVDVIQKGEETNLLSGDYILSSFDLSFTEDSSIEVDYSSFSTELKEPDIRTFSKTVDGSFFSKSYSYELPDSSIKFKKLDHSNLKDIYLAQIAGTIGLEEQSDGEIDNLPKYTFMFAKFSESGDLAFYAIAQDKKDILDYFNSKPVSLKIPEENKDLDFGIREITGNDDAVREAIISFAEMAMPNLLEPIIEFKQMCSGNPEEWTDCDGRVVESISDNHTEVSIGPYKKGKRAGIFYRKRIFNDGNEMHMAGEYVEGKFEGPWLYKLPTSQRIIEFKNHIPKKIRWKSNDTNHYFSGVPYSTDPGKVGSLNEGYVLGKSENGETQTRIGKFTNVENSSVGSLIRGKFSQGNYNFTGIFDENQNIKEGVETFEDTGSRYIGIFDDDQRLAFGSIVNDECELLGEFASKNDQNGSVTTTLIKGKTICGDEDKRITIGTPNPFCTDETAFGGPIYFQNKDFSFWGSTNATCQKYDYGIMIENSSGKAYAVKSGDSGFIKLKEVDLNQIMKEHSLN